MEEATLETLKSVTVIFSFPESNSIFTPAKLDKETVKQEALKSLIVIFSFPRSNSIFTLAKLSIHSSEKVRSTNGLVSLVQ